MNTIVDHSSGGVILGPEKVYTQGDIDSIVEKKVSKLAAIAPVVTSERQTVNAKKRLDKRTVASLVKKSNRILVSISSHAFPFDFFPNTINIEESRITIINRHMLSSEVHSVDLKDIANVLINSSIFFSQLVIISKTFEENEIKIRNLRTPEAVFARRIIEGLRTLDKEHVDTCNYSKAELITMLEDLSTTAIVM